MACDAPLPASPSLCFGAATDDVVILSKGGDGSVAIVAYTLDAAFAKAGIVTNASTELTDTLD
eukprot:2943794-Karenia_brevis.AAC.1